MAGHNGDRAVITAALADPEPARRATALTAAFRAGIVDTGVLRRFLADDDPDVRYRAIEIAARHPEGTSVADQLIGFLAPDDDRSGDLTGDEIQGTGDLAEVAAFALGELNLQDPTRTRAVTALENQARHHPDPLCREAAVAALGALGDGRATILAATADVATVRRRAVLALAPFDGPDIDQALNKALEDRDWQVRQAAEDLLG